MISDQCNCQTAETLKGKNFLEDETLLCSPQAEQPLEYHTVLSREENSVYPQVPDSKVGCRMTSVSVSKYPFQLKCMLGTLILLQDISSMLLACQHSRYDEDKLFFSSLASVSTTSDCILRKLREILMVISLDCTKFELLEEGKMSSSIKKQKEKLGTTKKKGKNRNAKKLHCTGKSSEHNNSLVKPAKVPLNPCRHLLGSIWMNSSLLIDLILLKHVSGKWYWPSI